MAHSSFVRRRQRRLVLAALLVVTIAGSVYLTLNTGLMAAVDEVVLRLRDAGPEIFFGAMALLPAAGFPMLAFTLAAGPVFGPTLGPGWVTAWSLLAVMVNLLLTYWLATRALRASVSRLLAYFGFSLPADPSGGAWQIALIVRLTPGPPFWVQSYLLGLIRIPLVPYLAVSTFVMAGYIVALVYGGEAIARSDGRHGLTALGALVVSVAVLQLLRKRTARRTAATVQVLSLNQAVAVK